MIHAKGNNCCTLIVVFCLVLNTHPPAQQQAHPSICNQSWPCSKLPAFSLPAILHKPQPHFRSIEMDLHASCIVTSEALSYWRNFKAEPVWGSALVHSTDLTVVLYSSIKQISALLAILASFQQIWTDISLVIPFSLYSGVLEKAVALRNQSR